MIIDMLRLSARATQRYPYTHRVEIVDVDDATVCKVIDWLKASGLAHSHIGWRVFYLTEESAAAFLLRWS